MQDRKWLLFTCWFSLRIFEDSETRKFSFLYKTKHAWADTVLKSRCVQFLNSLTLTEISSVQDRKWLLLTLLVSLRMFECWKIRKCCFSSNIVHLVAYLISFSIFNYSKIPKCCFSAKIITLSRHSFEQWAWQALDFTYIYGKVCCAR